MLRAQEDKSVHCVVLTGAGRAFCAGGDLEVLRDARKRKAVAEVEELVANPKFRELFQARIREFNKPLSDVETIADFKLIANPFTQENGELTPTMKLRRRVVEEHYRGEIEAMYGD